MGATVEIGQFQTSNAKRPLRLRNAAGRTSQIVDRNARTNGYNYDAGDRLTSATWKNNSGVTVNLLTYTYDAANNRLTARDSVGTATYTFDALNR